MASHTHTCTPPTHTHIHTHIHTHTQTENITISSPINNINGTSLYLTSNMDPQTLECTTGIDLAEVGYNVSWIKNFTPFSDQNSITVNPVDQKNEGYYCCQLLGQMMQTISTYCVTVAIRSECVCMYLCE